MNHAEEESRFIDADGIADWWERRYFGDLTTADATTDFDGDDLRDAFEYMARLIRFGGKSIDGVSTLN